MYSQHEMRPLGVSTLTIENPKTKVTYVSNFVVVNKTHTSILGARSAQAMALAQVEYEFEYEYEFISEGASTPSSGCTDMKQIVDAYQEVFKGE